LSSRASKAVAVVSVTSKYGYTVSKQSAGYKEARGEEFVTS